MAFVLSHRKKILAGLVFSFLCFFSTRTPAATPDDFKTQEYWNSTGLEIINAASAYAQGYTGEGVAVGMMDMPVRTTHPELEDKVLGILLPAGYPLGNWSEDAHDTVADRDTATLTASVTASLPHNLSIGLNAGTELGANHTDGWGGLKFGWTF